MNHDWKELHPQDEENPPVASWTIEVRVEHGAYTVGLFNTDGEYSAFTVMPGFTFEQAHAFVSKTLIDWGERVGRSICGEK